MDFFGKHNSGILTIKSTDTLTKRMVFTTHTGFKIFDFKIIKDSMILVDCIAPLKKKKILKILTTDLRYLAAISPNDKFVIKLKDKTSFITFSPTKSAKVIYEFRGNLQTKTDEIIIKHKGLPIKYKFAAISNIQE
jgi:hypothetical protein